MKKITVLLAAVLMQTATAWADCDANTNVASKCMDEATDALKTILNTNDDAEKSKSAGEAVGNCISCASETLGDQMRQIAPGSGSDDGGNSQ